ncbi:hypothetical protein QP140_03450 [Corynebacterium sp. UMB9976]|uniref:hypothetical protein n=1 Tax=Corynebacterium sp. UMB9976 TaxID=3046354 RepID=UPI002549F5F8|nr:hypothetical protein [Corynebacterium sp. UMB9976]MDK6301650.1 hypothetical protein [Corynebacterium sp. UMB9976]
MPSQKELVGRRIPDPEIASPQEPLLGVVSSVVLVGDSDVSVVGVAVASVDAVEDGASCAVEVSSDELRCLRYQPPPPTTARARSTMRVMMTGFFEEPCGVSGPSDPPGVGGGLLPQELVP